VQAEAPPAVHWSDDARHDMALVIDQISVTELAVTARRLRQVGCVPLVLSDVPRRRRTETNHALHVLGTVTGVVPVQVLYVEIAVRALERMTELLPLVLSDVAFWNI